MMDKLKLNKKGAMSIVSLILIISMVILASGYLTILQKTVVISEVQGNMDTTGLAALRYGVDRTQWLENETLAIDTATVNKQYRKLLSGQIDKMKNVKAHSYELVKVHAPDSPGLKNLGIPVGERDQYYLESLVILQIEKPSVFGPGSNTIWKYYNFFQGEDGNKYKDVKAFSLNGNDALAIRSVTRLVLR